MHELAEATARLQKNITVCGAFNQRAPDDDPDSTTKMLDELEDILAPTASRGYDPRAERRERLNNEPVRRKIIDQAAYLKKEHRISGSTRKSGNPSPVLTAREGLIVAHHGVAVEVLLSDGLRSMVRVKRRSGHVVGDRVKISGEALDRMPRRTELRRRDARGGIHLVGANFDVLGIVVAPLPVPPPGFIDRAIVAARAADLLPFVIVNKCDLADSAALVGALITAYAGAIPVFPVSAAAGSGLDPVRDFLKGNRGAFVGDNGCG